MSDAGPIPAILDRTKAKPFVGSYTALNGFKNVCEHQMFRRYIKKDQPFTASPEMQWGDEVHTAFEHRVGGGKPLPVSMQQWESFATPFDGRGAITEQKLGVTAQGQSCGFFDANVWFRGKIDLTLIDGTTAYLPDWKSGSSKYENPFELETNAVLLHAKHPQLTRIVGSYIWLKEHRISQLYDLSDTRKTWAELCRLMDLIGQASLTGEWRKMKSGLCGWCSVSDCENWKERK